MFFSGHEFSSQVEKITVFQSRGGGIDGFFCLEDIPFNTDNNPKKNASQLVRVKNTAYFMHEKNTKL